MLRIQKTTEVIYGILEDNSVTEYGFWGDTMGNYVVSQILYESDLDPKFIVQYNPVVNVVVLELCASVEEELQLEFDGLKTAVVAG